MKYGLIGEKLGHSFSKIIHEQLANDTYDLMPLSPDALEGFLTQKNFHAINVTIPYKESVLPYLDNIHPKAKKIGAVNTIVNENNRLTGYNTDYDGFHYLLENNHIQPKMKKVLILGKGGAAKSASAVLGDLGASEIHQVYYKESPETITYAQAYTLHSDAEIIINTTPVGMYPKSTVSPIDLSHFPKLLAVVDVIYNPLRTKLVLEAQERGCIGVGGLEMLVAQAKSASEIFHNNTLDETLTKKIHDALFQERQNLVLIGMSGCGKTTMGKALAQALGKPFFDTDEEILKRIGMPIATYFAQFGEVAFRQVEKEVVQSFSGETGIILATGGGVVTDAQNIQALKQNGRILWIKRDVSRLESGSGRPLAPNQEATKALYAKRLPLYQNAAEVIFENQGSVDEGILHLLTQGYITPVH